MEFLFALLPAAGCAALMVVCFRMMRHSAMHGSEPEPKDDVVALREEVAALRDELTRPPFVPAEKGDG